jgi:hypothetical protein
MGFQDRYSTKYIPFNDASQAAYEAECNRRIWGDTLYECGATIWTPNLNPNFVEDRAFSLYAMECEGDLPTRRGKINQVIKMMAAAGPMCNDFETQCAIYDEVGIDSDTFTEEEVSYIEREVAKRLC